MSSSESTGYNPAGIDPDLVFLRGVLSDFPQEQVDALVPPGKTAGDLFSDDRLLSDQVMELRYQLKPPPTDAELWAAARKSANESRDGGKTARLVGTAAACAGGFLGSIGLIVAAVSSQSRTEEYGVYADPPAVETPDSRPPQTALTLPRLPSYKEAVIHFVNFEGTVPIGDAKKQEAVAMTASALGVLGTAYKGHWNIGSVPVRADTVTHDLTGGGLSISATCAKTPGNADVDTLTNRVVETLSNKTAIEPDVLDIVIMEADDAVACRDIPVGQVSKQDVVIYEDTLLTEATLAHEIIHLTRYGHDGRYDTRPSGNTVTVDAKTGWFLYGNEETLSGDGARARKVTDKDPLSGYLMLQAGVIAPEQLVTVPEASALNVELSALTADDATLPLKLVKLPLRAENRPNQADAIMIELSYEGPELTLKAYGTDKETASYTSTYAIPLSEQGIGMGGKALNQPMVIDLGGEKITLTLTALGSGDNATASVSIHRS